jgi:hypothetical protein
LIWRSKWSTFCHPSCKNCCSLKYREICYYFLNLTSFFLRFKALALNNDIKDVFERIRHWARVFLSIVYLKLL